MKSIKLKRPTKQQCILLHDLYYEASEPDSPKKKFEFLSDLEKETGYLIGQTYSDRIFSKNSSEYKLADVTEVPFSARIFINDFSLITSASLSLGRAGI